MLVLENCIIFQCIKKEICSKFQLFFNRLQRKIFYSSTLHKVHKKALTEHGRIIKWTQHTGFLTLAGMERVVQGNYGNDFKEG